MNFDDRINRLKEICRILSGNNTSLEETASLYKEGMALSDECLKAIAGIRQELSLDKAENNDGSDQ